MPAVLIDQHGVPIKRGDVARARAKGLINGGITPFDSADRWAPEMAGWNPWLGSPDSDTTPYRDISVARIRDIVRNDGWASGAVEKLVDSTIGAEFRLSAMPDYRALGRRLGSAFDATWAKEFSEAVEACWRSWAMDVGRYCDTGRQLKFPQMARLAFRHYLVEGEALALLPWREDRRGYGRARYATTMQVIDPDRLSNPQLRMDTHNIRGGVEVDNDDVPVAYHVRKAHQNNWFDAAASVTWERIEAEEDWGRPRVVHHFDKERAGQHRPVGGIFTPVLARMRMLFQYDRVELQAAIVNAIFGAYIKSPFDPEDIEESMRDRDGISRYQQQRLEFHQDRRLMAGEVQLSTLYPGEDISVISASRPAAAFDAFEGAVLRNFAAGIGASYETVSGDYRGSSYSSARQALLGEWRTISRRRKDFGGGMCTPAYVALLEELIDRGDVPMPRGSSIEFAEARTELSRCKWIGPGRGWVDPTKEPEGSKMKIAAGLSTLEREAAENDGLDWIENLDQLKLEKDEAEKRGLTLVHDTAVAQQEAGQDASPAVSVPRPAAVQRPAGAASAEGGSGAGGAGGAVGGDAHRPGRWAGLRRFAGLLRAG